ncbi:MAG TPA: pitrilysin family protein [Gemmatimonadaceae bacterium]|nr:pitrilysin family protein [Gemmatimonadaceae bacterium]
MQIPIETWRLDNGLRVVFSEDHTAPIVAVNLWYHVGSANEREGRTGFAHLFEHMLFQGSENVAANEHFELVQRAGGTLNGSTWLDRTNYFETVPSNQLALALWLEADRMGRLLPAMTQEKLDTQRDVVKNERRWTVDNQPYGSWWERLPMLAFPPSHPFHHSLIGSMEDLSAASLDDVGAFFATWYAPDNAVLSIAGDFDPREATTLVQRYFGGIPAGGERPPLPPMALEPVFGDPRREVVEDQVALPRLFVACRVPPFGTPEHVVARTLAAILGLRRGSRLHRVLVREREVAAEVGAFTFDLSKGNDLLIVDVLARGETSASVLEEEVERLLDTVHESGVTAAELERALALIETSFVSAMQSAGERADRLSMFATYFDEPRIVNEELAMFHRVTLADVNAFASRFLGRNNRVSLLYIPKPAPPAATDAPVVEALS